MLEAHDQAAAEYDAESKFRVEFYRCVQTIAFSTLDGFYLAGV
jgi:hypothetical protein